MLLFMSCCLTACSSTRSLNRRGVPRIRTYHIHDAQIPSEFNDYTIAFISDLHYKSTLQQRGLNKLAGQIVKMSPDLLLLGGDYREGDGSIAELFSTLGRIEAPDGIMGVLGNNDYEVGYEEIVEEAERNKIRLLEDRCDMVLRGNARIWIAGVKDPFARNLPLPPDRMLPQEDFVLLLVHTPDYVERVELLNTDLALAGHTHGGQVTLLGMYAPVLPSRYGQRFRTGRCRSSHGVPMIVTNGIGTSQRNIRLFAPAEIVRLVLHPR